MSWHKKVTIDIQDTKTSAPPAPKPPTLVEKLKIQLDEIDQIIAAQHRDRHELYELILWIQLTPDAERRMAQIAERCKPILDAVKAKDSSI
jgi:hypothetical protein